jgi:hypothetical protein
LPHLGDFLNRFRPAGAPGAASQVGVPADRAAELSAELSPVLARLAATEAECAWIIADANDDARRITDEAQGQAARIAADGRRRAQLARAEAAAGVLTAARAQASQAEWTAAERARARPRPAEDQVRALTAQAVRLVLALADGGRVGPNGADGPQR